jgi:hypothetical protein
MEKRNGDKGFAEKHEENTKGACGLGLRKKKSSRLTAISLLPLTILCSKLGKISTHGKV